MSPIPIAKQPFDGAPRLPGATDADRAVAWLARHCNKPGFEMGTAAMPSGAIPSIQVSAWAQLPAVLKRIHCDGEQIRLDFPMIGDRATRDNQREIRRFLQECHGKSFSEYSTQLAEKLSLCQVFATVQRDFSPAFRDPKDWIEAHGLNYTGPQSHMSVTDVYSGSAIAAGGAADAQRVLSEHITSGRPLVVTVDEEAGASSAAAVFKEAVEQNRSLEPAADTARVWRFKDPMAAGAKELPQEISLRKFIEEVGLTAEDGSIGSGVPGRAAAGDDDPASKCDAPETGGITPANCEGGDATVPSLVPAPPPQLPAVDNGLVGGESGAAPAASQEPQKNDLGSATPSDISMKNVDECLRAPSSSTESFAKATGAPLEQMPTEPNKRRGEEDLGVSESTRERLLRFGSELSTVLEAEFVNYEDVASNIQKNIEFPHTQDKSQEVVQTQWRSRIGSMAQVVIPAEEVPFEVTEGQGFKILRECRERPFGETVKMLLRSADKLIQLKNPDKNPENVETTTGAKQEGDVVVLPKEGSAIFFSDLEGGVRNLAMVIDHYNLIERWEKKEPIVLCVLGDSVDRSPTGSLLLEYLLELKFNRGFVDKIVVLAGNHELTVQMNCKDLEYYRCAPNLLADLLKRSFPKETNQERPEDIVAFMRELCPKAALELLPKLTNVDEALYRERFGLYVLFHFICRSLPWSIVSDRGLFAAHAGFPMHGAFESIFKEPPLHESREPDWWRKKLADIRGASHLASHMENDMTWNDLTTDFGAEGDFTALDDPRRRSEPSRPKFTMDDFSRFAKVTGTSCMIRGHQNSPRKDTVTPKGVEALLKVEQRRKQGSDWSKSDHCNHVWAVGNIVTLEHESWGAILDLSKEQPSPSDFSWIGILRNSPEEPVQLLLSMPPLAEAAHQFEEFSAPLICSPHQIEIAPN